MHIGVDDVFGLIHSVKSTKANVHDISVSQSLISTVSCLGTSRLR
ncbi:hypothetical protein ACGRPS_13465 [Vibrio furnissii]